MEQNTEEWLEMRKTKVGASDAPIIMGVSPWKTPFQLWEEKLGLRSSSFQTPAMKRGHEMEEPARQWYMATTGNMVVPDVIFHQEKNWMMASLDGKGINCDMVIEIKNPGIKDHEVAMNGMIPEKYFPQLQHQLACSGLDLMHYVSFYNNQGFIVEVKRDDDYINNLYEKEEEFWWKVKNLVEPDKTDRDAVVRTDDDFLVVLEKWKKAKQYLDSWKEKEDLCRRDLIAVAGNDSYVKSNNVTIKRTISKGRVQYNEIPELVEIDLDKYRKDPVVTWRITNDKSAGDVGEYNAGN